MNSTMYEIKTRLQCTVMNMTIARKRFGKNCLKAGIVEPEQKSIASHRLAKHKFLLQRTETE
jgi:hypothetical protein